MRLIMSDLDRAALEKVDGKTAVVLYIVPRCNQPGGSTHAVYQGIRGRRDHPQVGHALFYQTTDVPQHLMDGDERLFI